VKVHISSFEKTAPSNSVTAHPAIIPDANLADLSGHSFATTAKISRRTAFFHGSDRFTEDILKGEALLACSIK
jgi:hypothetical protein